MSTKTILIVDDSATARLLFKVSIQALEDYNLIEASNPEEAIKLVKEFSPFLVVLDYNMPEKVGTEVAQEILALGLSPHLILLTANTQDSIVEEAKSLGFLEVLEKPVSADSVMAILDRLS